MANYNQNAGYGQALLNAVHAAVPSFGKIFVVVDPDDTDEENYQRLQQVFLNDPSGVVRFFTDLPTAYAATESNNNDVIVLDGNSTHVLTSMLTVSNNRVHFIGLDYLMGIKRKYGQSTKISLTATTGATNIATIKNTGVRNSFRGIKFVNSSTVTEGIYCFADGGEYTYIECCEIYKDTDLDQTGAAELVANGDSSYYKDCYIGSTVNAISGAILRPCVTFSRELANTGAVARDVTFEGCVFARKFGNSGNRFMYGAEATAVERLCLIDNCVFWGAALSTAIPAQNVAFGATLTDGSVLLKDCISIAAGTAMSTTTGVFVDMPLPDAAAGGIALQAS